MKKTREQKIEKLEKKLAKLKMPKVNYSFNPSNVYPGNLYQAFATPKLEVGKWYKSPKYGKAIFYITNITNKKVDAYGLNYKYEWKNEKEFGDSISEDYELATDKEVETALISEAKKRGFKEWVTISSEWIESEILVNGDELFFDEHLELCLGSKSSYFTIFKDGKWAEIIEDSKPKINGYEMEVKNGDVVFGCAKFHQYYLEKVLELCKLSSFTWDNDGGGENCKNEGYRTIKSIKLSSDVEITVDELKEVVDYLNK